MVTLSVLYRLMPHFAARVGAFVTRAVSAAPPSSGPPRGPRAPSRRPGGRHGRPAISAPPTAYSAPRGGHDGSESDDFPRPPKPSSRAAHYRLWTQVGRHRQILRHSQLEYEAVTRAANAAGVTATGYVAEAALAAAVGAEEKARELQDVTRPAPLPTSTRALWRSRSCRRRRPASCSASACARLPRVAIARRHDAPPRPRAGDRRGGPRTPNERDPDALREAAAVITCQDPEMDDGAARSREARLLRRCALGPISAGNPGGTP